MSRDIDLIISGIKEQFPQVSVSQIEVKYPGVDDDGVWIFTWPQRGGDIQVESSSGMCPFLIEHNKMKSTSEAWRGDSVDDTIEKLSRYFDALPSRQ